MAGITNGRVFCASFGVLLFGLLSLVGPGSAQETPAVAPKKSSQGHVKRKPAAEPAPAILVGAGDIAGCADLSGAEATAKLIEGIPGTVFAAGDLAYEKGSAQEFQECYGKTWGRFKDRTRPALGNHEYKAGDTSPYFEYWGTKAGKPGQGYYSYELGSWHIVVLNTNCSAAALGGL